MISLNKSYCLLLGVTLVMGSFVNDVVMAADCKTMHDAIRKERALMKKKAMVEAALESCPEDPGVVYQNGYVFERLRKYKKALVSYEKAIVLDSGYAKAYFSTGDISALQKNYDKAVDAYTKGLQHDPDDERAKGSLKMVLAKYKGTTKGANVTVVSAKPVVKDKKIADHSKSSAVTSLNYVEAPITRLEIPFHKKTATLSQDAQDVLSVVVGQAMNRDDIRNSKFEIGGHTDNSGDAEKNNDISRQRALRVQNYLTDNFGIGSDRLKIVPHGQKNPKVANNSSAKRAINRRVDFAKID